MEDCAFVVRKIINKKCCILTEKKFNQNQLMTLFIIIETNILLLNRGREESDKDSSYYGRYDNAVWHGQLGDPCKELFPLCMYSAPQIMGNTAINAINTTTNTINTTNNTNATTITY